MIVFVTILFSFLFSDYYNHPELNWKNMETENFIICFHQGTERSAGEIATIVEEIHDEVTSLYDFIPDTKTTIIIEDVEKKDSQFFKYLSIFLTLVIAWLVYSFYRKE